MPKTTEKTIYQLVGEYANTLGRFGPESEQVQRFRAAHADNRELMEYAKSLDRIKRHFSGKSRKQAAPRAGKLIGR